MDQLHQFGVGFGLLNEQGGELIHAEFNRIGRVVQEMRGDLDKLLATMRRQHQNSAATLQNLGRTKNSKKKQSQ